MAAGTGVASLAIALILAGVAMLVARESKALLIGRARRPATRRRHHTDRPPGCRGSAAANSIVTVQLAPATWSPTLSLDFFDYMRAPDIERAVVQLEEKIRGEHPEVSALFVKPQSVATAKSSAAEAIMTPDDVFGAVSGGTRSLSEYSAWPPTEADFASSRGGADAVGSGPNKEATTTNEAKSARSRRVGRGGASASLRVWAVEPATACRARSHPHPRPANAGSRGILRQAPGRT